VHLRDALVEEGGGSYPGRVARRGNKPRQQERKARNISATAKLFQPDPAYEAPFTEERRQRVLQKFANLTSRGMTLSFVSMGITVNASNPGELHRETAKALAEITKGQTPS